MIHVLTAKMVSGAPWDPLGALIVNLDAFVATCRQVVPVALQELSVDRRQSSAKNVLQGGCLAAMALDSSMMTLSGFRVARLATCNAPFAMHALYANP